MAIVMLAIPAFVAFALWAFAWPAARSAPNDLPVGVAGPPAAAEQVAGHLRAEDGAFDVHVYPDAGAARAAIEDRDIYGAFVVGESGDTELLTARAASAAVADLLAHVAEEAAPEGATVPVTDVVPPSAGDPRGSVFNTTMLPLALAGIAVGAIVTLTGLRGGRAVAAVIGAALLAGLGGALIGHSWLGIFEGSWLEVAGVLALIALAGSATVAGAAALIGPPGIGLGALFVMLLGNPWSGAGSAPEMLPDPVGTIGQYLPTGAGATALRSVAYFDGAGAALAFTVLATWTVLGLTSLALRGRGKPQPAN
ncbi:ABC transporter permease [Streptomyces sp. NBC_01803]|uniref:ABC transporter permease n=1 Tax=Streptomyces sp. NBC_01803 TaxID=2975946 RepID=UPI002DD8099B|nr:ABC transporter permease [Streptomyces sp. NBC_01803]WSA44631.1 ABC transporter permease [Streptomyces sp. NBC_01803]